MSDTGSDEGESEDCDDFDDGERSDVDSESGNDSEEEDFVSNVPMSRRVAEDNWSWQILPDSEVPLTFRLDIVDKELLATARLELPELAKRWLQFKFGANTKKTNINLLTLEDMTQMWMSGGLLETFIEDINASLEDKVNASEFFQFVQVTWWLLMNICAPL